MTRYLLDTNIVSQLTKPQRSATLIDWWARQEDDDLCISAHTVGEIWQGIQMLPAGARKQSLISWFQGATGPMAMFADRVIPYDGVTAIRWADLMSSERAAGRPRSAPDMIIAATALVNGCVVVTDNERDFVGVVNLINPVRNAIP